MKRVLVIGGASGIGLSLSLYLANQDEVEHVYVLDKKPFDEQYKLDKISAEVFDVTSEDYSLLDNYADVDALYITAGYGHLGMVEDFDDKYIRSIFAVNAEGPIRILRHFYPRMLETKPFYCAVMVSIAAHLSSPLFAYYSATKAAVRMFIEAANVELEVQGSENRIMEVSPGSLKGTSFNGGQPWPERLSIVRCSVSNSSSLSTTRCLRVYCSVIRTIRISTASVPIGTRRTVASTSKNSRWE